MATQATASKGASRMPMPSVRSSASLPFTADEKIEAAVRERMHHGRQTGGEPSGALGAGPSSLSRGSRDKEGERLIKAQEFMRLLRERREVQRKKSVPEIFSSALRTLLRNFALAYNLRFAASFVLRLFNVIRKDGFRRALDLEHLVDEGALKFRADGVRLGLLLGGFTGAFRLMQGLLGKFRGRYDGVNTFVAGAVGGLSILFLENSERRRTFGLYLMVRGIQSVYCALLKRGMPLFYPAEWKHGDSLLFILSSAQIMYAYVMRPETLPSSYWRFIVNAGPITKDVLTAVRRNNRGLPVDVDKLLAYCEKAGGKAAVTPPPLTSALPDAIPLGVLHPQQPNALLHVWETFARTYRNTLGVHMTAYLVPMVVFKYRKFLSAPASVMATALLGALRSTAFLSSLCASYMATVIVHRKIFKKDHKLVYYVAGLISCCAIFIEHPARRLELALYAFPRGADSLYRLLVDNKIVARISSLEVMAFCASMGSLMYCFEHENETTAGLVNSLLQKLVI